MDQPTTLSVFTAPFPFLKFLFPNKKGILWFLNLRISHLVFKIPEFYVTPRDMARLSDSMLKKASAGPALNRSLAYIVKPVSASRGRGIFFANKVIQIRSIDRSVLRDRHRHVLYCLVISSSSSLVVLVFLYPSNLPSVNCQYLNCSRMRFLLPPVFSSLATLTIHS